MSVQGTSPQVLGSAETGRGIPRLSAPSVLTAAIAASLAAGILVSRGGITWFGLAIGGALGLGVTLTFMLRPYCLFCLAVVCFALDALTLVSSRAVFSLTLTKFVAIPLMISCARVAYRHPVRLKPDYGLMCVAGFLAFVLASWMAAEDFARALRATLTLLQLGLLVAVVRLLVISITQLRQLAGVIVISISVSAVAALWQFFSDPASRIYGTAQNAALLSADLSAALAFAIALTATTGRASTRLLWLVLAALITAGIGVTLSRAAYLAFIPALVVGALYYGQMKRFVVVGLVLVALLVPFAPIIGARLGETSPADRSTIGHVNSIMAGLRMTADNPFFGVGAGNYIMHYLEYTNDPRGMPRSAHNTYLSISSEIGVPALALLLGAHILAFAVLGQTRRRCLAAGDTVGLAFCAATAAGLAAFALIGCFHSLHLAKYLWILLGLGISQASFSSAVWRGTGPLVPWGSVLPYAHPLRVNRG